MDSLGDHVMMGEDNGGLGCATDPKQSMDILDNLKSLNMVAVMSMMLILCISVLQRVGEFSELKNA
jgi:hypothetical protein